MKAKKLPTTTEIPDYYYYGDRYDKYGNIILDLSAEYYGLSKFDLYNEIDFDADYVFDALRGYGNLMAEIVLFCTTVYQITAVVNFIVNIPHLFILFQRELRTNLVYIVMIGISMCDILHSIGAMYHQAWELYRFHFLDPCDGYGPYYYIFAKILSNTLQIFSRRCSSLLSLFIASFRAFSVIFPMSNAVNFLMKAKSGFLINVVFGSVCGVFSFVYFWLSTIERGKPGPNGEICQGFTLHDSTLKYQYTEYQPYRFKTGEMWQKRYRLANGFASVFVSFAYVAVAAALVVALCIAQKRRQNLKNENKPSNTTTLVVMMAISIFLSEIAYGTIFIFAFFIFEDKMEQSFLEELDVLAYTLSMISSASHCIICFFMSSQYRDVVKRLVGWKEKVKEVKIDVVAVESGVHPSTVQTSKTSNDSKKTF